MLGRVPGLVILKEESLIKVIHDDIVIEGDLTVSVRNGLSLNNLE